MHIFAFIQIVFDSCVLFHTITLIVIRYRKYKISVTCIRKMSKCLRSYIFHLHVLVKSNVGVLFTLHFSNFYYWNVLLMFTSLTNVENNLHSNYVNTNILCNFLELYFFNRYFSRHISLTKASNDISSHYGWNIRPDN